MVFRWRKELCRVDEPRADVATTLVPVIVSEAAPTVFPATPGRLQHPTPDASGTMWRSNLVADVVSRVDSRIETEALGRILDCAGVADDPGSSGVNVW